MRLDQLVAQVQRHHHRFPDFSGAGCDREIERQIANIAQSHGERRPEQACEGIGESFESIRREFKRTSHAVDQANRTYRFLVLALVPIDSIFSSSQTTASDVFGHRVVNGV